MSQQSPLPEGMHQLSPHLVCAGATPKMPVRRPVTGTELVDAAHDHVDGREADARASR